MAVSCLQLTFLLRVNETIEKNPHQLDIAQQTCSDTCSCNDCPVSCPLPPKFPSPPRSCIETGSICFPYLSIALLAAYGGLILMPAIFITLLCKRDSQVMYESIGADQGDLDPKFGPSHTSFLVQPSFYKNCLGTEVTVPQHGLLSGLSRFWKGHGEFVASRPYLVIIISILVVILASIWIYRLQIDSNPETLWVPPNSRAAQDKKYFDDHFGPFYRINMMIITQRPGANQTVPLPLYFHPRQTSLSMRSTSAYSQFFTGLN